MGAAFDDAGRVRAAIQIVETRMIEYRSASTAVPPMAWAVSEPARSASRLLIQLHMSYTVYHPFERASWGSSTGRLLGVLPLPGADNVARRENLHGVHRTCSNFYTHTLRNV